MTSSDRVAQARSLQTPDDAVQLYRTWADQYDHDVFEVLGFIGTQRIADLLAQYLPDLHADVIDLGCGTGGAGVRLAELGLATVDGIDISPEMLQVAARRGVYRHLITADLTRPLEVEHRYDGAVSAGTFTSGHVGPDALPAIVALLQPGAVIAWVVATSMWPSFEPAMTALGFRMRSVTHEPIRREGPAEAMMVVAVLD